VPITKSAFKRMRKAKEQELRNKAAKSGAKTAVKKALATIGTGQPDPAALAQATSALDKAASKGALHKNAAARRKSRLARAANKAATAPSA